MTRRVLAVLDNSRVGIAASVVTSRRAVSWAWCAWIWLTASCCDPAAAPRSSVPLTPARGGRCRALHGDTPGSLLRRRIDAFPDGSGWSARGGCGVRRPPPGILTARRDPEDHNRHDRWLRLLPLRIGHSRRVTPP